MTTINVKSPAKLNLFLHITGRRDNGYHDLQTLFELIDLVDDMSFTLTPNSDAISIEPPVPGVPLTENLIYRAANLLRQQTKQKICGVKISIDKRIPMGGGLGGGSSNAATTLLVLNKLWQLNLDLHQLADIGLGLGADVPIFIHGHPAWAEGVGEIIEAVPTQDRIFLLIAPNCHVSTAKIFNDKELTRDTSAIKLAPFLAGGTSKYLEEGWQTGFLHNDCEATVRRHYQEVHQALNWLDQFDFEKNQQGRSRKSRMTGTGACVFLAFDRNDESQQKAHEILQQVPNQWQAYLVHSLHNSPVHEVLKDL